jgi:hypothetical protein
VRALSVAVIDLASQASDETLFADFAALLLAWTHVRDNISSDARDLVLDTLDPASDTRDRLIRAAAYHEAMSHVLTSDVEIRAAATRLDQAQTMLADSRVRDAAESAHRLRTLLEQHRTTLKSSKDRLDRTDPAHKVLESLVEHSAATAAGTAELNNFRLRPTACWFQTRLGRRLVYDGVVAPTSRAGRDRRADRCRIHCCRHHR